MHFLNPILLVPVENDVIDKINTATNDGEFAGVTNGTISLTKDVYHLLAIIGGYGGVLMLICALILYMYSNAHSRQEAKTKIVWILVGVAGVFLSAWLVDLLFRAARGY